MAAGTPAPLGDGGSRETEGKILTLKTQVAKLEEELATALDQIESDKKKLNRHETRNKELEDQLQQQTEQVGLARDHTRQFQHLRDRQVEQVAEKALQLCEKLMASGEAFKQDDKEMIECTKTLLQNATTSQTSKFDSAVGLFNHFIVNADRTDNTALQTAADEAKAAADKAKAAADEAKTALDAANEEKADLQTRINTEKEAADEAKAALDALQGRANEAEIALQDNKAMMGRFATGLRQLMLLELAPCLQPAQAAPAATSSVGGGAGFGLAARAAPLPNGLLAIAEGGAEGMVEPGPGSVWYDAGLGKRKEAADSAEGGASKNQRLGDAGSSAVGPSRSGKKGKAAGEVDDQAADVQILEIAKNVVTLFAENKWIATGAPRALDQMRAVINFAAGMEVVDESAEKVDGAPLQYTRKQQEIAEKMLLGAAKGPTADPSGKPENAGNGEGKKRKAADEGESDGKAAEKSTDVQNPAEVSPRKKAKATVIAGFVVRDTAREAGEGSSSKPATNAMVSSDAVPALDDEGCPGSEQATNAEVSSDAMPGQDVTSKEQAEIEKALQTFVEMAPGKSTFSKPIRPTLAFTVGGLRLMLHYVKKMKHPHPPSGKTIYSWHFVVRAPLVTMDKQDDVVDGHDMAARIVRVTCEPRTVYCMATLSDLRTCLGNPEIQIMETPLGTDELPKPENVVYLGIRKVEDSGLRVCFKMNGKDGRAPPPPIYYYLPNPRKYEECEALMQQGSSGDGALMNQGASGGGAASGARSGVTLTMKVDAAAPNKKTITTVIGPTKGQRFPNEVPGSQATDADNRRLIEVISTVKPGDTIEFDLKDGVNKEEDMSKVVFVCERPVVRGIVWDAGERQALKSMVSVYRPHSIEAKAGKMDVKLTMFGRVLDVAEGGENVDFEKAGFKDVMQAFGRKKKEECFFTGQSGVNDDVTGHRFFQFSMAMSAPQLYALIGFDRTNHSSDTAMKIARQGSIVRDWWDLPSTPENAKCRAIFDGNAFVGLLMQDNATGEQKLFTPHTYMRGMLAILGQTD